MFPWNPAPPAAATPSPWVSARRACNKAQDGVITADVTLVERLGGLTLLHIKAEGGQDMTVQIEGSDATKIQEQVRLGVDKGACHLFDKNGQAFQQSARHPLAA